MLSSLSIKNYALIDELNVSFGSGLTIITGETGAGKSILLGGLSLVLGKRADISNVKDVAKKCIVEATFDIANYNLKRFFSDENLDYEAETIIRREILPSGKSRAFVNDTPVNLEVLRLLSGFLIDIHSQHQTLELTQELFQFQIIDALASNKDILAKYDIERANLKDLENSLQDLTQRKSEGIKEQDYNEFLYSELQNSSLIAGELEGLETEYETLNNIESIEEELSKSFGLLNNEEIGVLSVINSLKSSLQKLSHYSHNYAVFFNRINSVYIELDDLLAEIETKKNNLEANPGRLEAVNSKLQIIHNLLHKHAVMTVEELLVVQSNLESKIDIVINIDENISAIENKICQSKSRLDQLADTLHKNREQVIPSLIKQLESILVELGMQNARFNISVTKTNSYLLNGTDEIAFLFKANKGAEFKSLKKAASGGELSRIMLAIKSILANYIQLPSIMFDEIDTGVSGEISNKMALIMQRMSKRLQVFSITHLPQIAAKGDTHYKVFKEDDREGTITKLVRLNWDDRIVEIAQMLGGSKMSSSAIEHAKQLLN